MNREIHGKKVVNAFRSCSKADEDGVYNWPQHGLKYGRGSEKLAAHTQQKMTHVPPGTRIIYHLSDYQVLKFLYLQWFYFLPFF